MSNDLNFNELKNRFSNFDKILDGEIYDMVLDINSDKNILTFYRCFKVLFGDKFMGIKRVLEQMSANYYNLLNNNRVMILSILIFKKYKLPKCLIEHLLLPLLKNNTNYVLKISDNFDFLHHVVMIKSLSSIFKTNIFLLNLELFDKCLLCFFKYDYFFNINKFKNDKFHNESNNKITDYKLEINQYCEYYNELNNLVKLFDDKNKIADMFCEIVFLYYEFKIERTYNTINKYMNDILTSEKF